MNSTVGIIGGAGPEAGALLFNQMIRLCQSRYGCWHDRDFPQITLISYPFSEMLEGEQDRETILEEILSVYEQLQSDTVVMACNTAHAFLPEDFAPDNFYHLIKGTTQALSSTPLMICSSTSRKNRLHERFFSCSYPEDQEEVDAIINAVLHGDHSESIHQRLCKVMESSQATEVVLGCTELSILHDTSPLIVEGKTIIDPSLVAADAITKRTFNAIGVS